MAKTTPFVNSMDEGNYPDTAGRSEELDVQHEQQDTKSGTPWAGDEERTIQDNGLNHSGIYKMGDPSGNKFPGQYMVDDSNADDETSVLEYGTVDDKEVGYNGNVACYGLDGYSPPAGSGPAKSRK